MAGAIVLLHRPADAPVVEPDRVACPHVGEHLRQRAADVRRRQHAARAVQRRRLARLVVGRQQQQVALVQQQVALLRRQFAHPGFAVFAVPAFAAQHDAGRQIGGVGAQAPGIAGADLDDLQAARTAAGVLEADAVALGEVQQPVGADRQAGVRLGRRLDRLVRRMQPEARRRGDAAEGIALRAHLPHLRPRRHRPGAQLRPGQVHQHLAAPLERLLSASQVFDHAQPGARLVVGAVDAHAVHAAGQEVVHQLVVEGRLARHGHHDAHVAADRGGAEQGLGMTVQKLGAGLEAERCRPGGQRRLAACEPVQHAQHGVDAGQHMRFGTAEGGQAEFGQARLQRTQVVLPHGEVVHQVARAVAVVRMDRLGRADGPVGQLDQGGAQAADLFDQRIENG